VRDIQAELDDIIEQGVVQITRLLRNSENSNPSSDSIEDDFNAARHKHNYLRGTYKHNIILIIFSTHIFICLIRSSSKKLQ